MAAATLLRSVARNLARRAPATHPRPLLAHGLRDGATAAARAPPATTQPHHRLLHGRGLHSRASPDHPSAASGPMPPQPTSDVDKIERLFRERDKVDLQISKIKAGFNVVTGCVILGMMMYMFPLEKKMPEAEAKAEVSSSRRTRTIVNRKQQDDGLTVENLEDLRAEVKAIEARMKENQDEFAELNLARESARAKVEKLENEERCSRERIKEQCCK